jgi:hypothetical protein
LCVPLEGGGNAAGRGGACVRHNIDYTICKNRVSCLLHDEAYVVPLYGNLGSMHWVNGCVGCGKGREMQLGGERGFLFLFVFPGLRFENQK